MSENQPKMDKLFECYICQALFSHKCNIETHIASIHGCKKPFKCSICDYSGSKKRDITRHIASVHEGKKPFKCSICDYKCSQKGQLTKHISSNHEIKFLNILENPKKITETYASLYVINNLRIFSIFF